MKQIGNKVIGLVLVVVGVIIALNALEITNINIFFDGWWTLIIIIPCVVGLFKDEEKTGSIVGIVLGVFMLLCSQNVISWDMLLKLGVPCILVIIGLGLIFKDVLNRDTAKRIDELNKEKTGNTICATFSGQDVKVDEEKFEGSTVDAIFGGVKLDLTKAVIEKDCVINATSIFGGIDIIVPESVKVKVNSTAIFGGVDNKRESSEDSVNTIYVNALCLFGGIDIK